MDGIELLNLPDVCTNWPAKGKAFCADHCSFLHKEAPNVPCDLREFLKYCGMKEGMSCTKLLVTLTNIYSYINRN